MTSFGFDSNDAVIISGRFTNQAWELLGSYIANNTHLYRLAFPYCNLTNEKMALLFGMLINSDSIKELNINGNTFGIEGLRSMLPFLESRSSQLTKLTLGNNNEIDTECFKYWFGHYKME